MSNFVYTTAIDKIRNMSARKKIVQGGTSASKTFGILAILIDKAAREPGTEISVVSESIPHIRRGSLKDFLKIMRMTNRFVESHYNKTLLKYEFANGSYIEFFSVDDESKLRGARRNVLYVNEANNIYYEAYLQLAIRTSGDIYIDFNPTSRFWVHDEVLKENDSEMIILNYLDNEALDQNIIKELEANREKAATSDYWKNWCRVYLDGEIGSLDGVVYSNWSEIDSIPTEARLLGWGLDLGFTNDPSALVAVYKYNDSIIVDEVIYQKGLLNSDIANLFSQNKVVGDIFADSADPKSIEELKRYGYRVNPAKKGPDSILFGIGIIQEHKLLITKRSNNLKDELNRYCWAKDKEGNALNYPIDSHNHALDALRYFAMMRLTTAKTGVKIRGGVR